MLDVRTLQFAATLAAWNMALAVGLMLWRRFPRGIGLYALALLLQALSQTVSLLRDDLPVLPAVLVSNVTLAASFALEYVGLARFYGLPHRRGLALALPAAVVAAALLAVAWAPEALHLRIGLTSAGYAAQHAVLLGLLRRVGDDQRNRPYYLLVVVMALSAVMLATRAAVALTAPPPLNHYFEPSALQAWTMAAVQALFEFNAVAVLIAVHHRDEDRISELVSHDALTGVDSRHTLFSQGRHLVALAQRSEQALSLLMIDFDHFKDRNDRYGHGVGDRILVAATAAMRRALRPSDRLGRYGGEEFCALLSGADVQAAAAVAERIREAVRQVVLEVDGQRVGVTVSIGVAQVRLGGDDSFEALLQRADRAMYAAKAAGRDCVRQDHAA